MTGFANNDVALLYDQVGNMLLKLKNYNDSKVAFEKALTIRQHIHGDSHLDIAKSKELIASVQEEWGNLSEAIVLYEEALSLRYTHHGSRTSTDIADILVKLAQLGECHLHYFEM